MTSNVANCCTEKIPGTPCPDVSQTLHKNAATRRLQMSQNPEMMKYQEVLTRLGQSWEERALSVQLASPRGIDKRHGLNTQLLTDISSQAVCTKERRAVKLEI
jgi:hypothetical protein